MANLNPAPPSMCGYTEAVAHTRSLATVPPGPTPLTSQDYRVRIGSRVFQGSDIRGLLRLAVAARRAQG